MKLAESLENEGADVIQTEGGKYSNPLKPGVLGLIEKVEDTRATIFITAWERKKKNAICYSSALPIGSYCFLSFTVIF